MDRKSSNSCPTSLEFIEGTTRLWGILSMIVMWGVGVDLTLHKHSLGIYTLDEKNFCFQCWQHIQWVDLWKKTILYLFLSIFCFFRPVEMWLAVIGGSMLIVLALLYLVFAYKLHLTEQEALLYDKECSYDRFEDLQDEIDDSLPEPCNGNIADQDTILRV